MIKSSEKMVQKCTIFCIYKQTFKLLFRTGYTFLKKASENKKVF